ncbi:MAG: inorganic phosphate transporter [Candidatus Dormibacteraeota bacterium]|nr:inorganic phosphate transporter [Candidatus Dormibacteraeota bacterium]MBO0705115.1 inorganic phosphate transporter [Candidatus Dormibacteraeota bacterium]MBO0762117.1 inorganic phosphate transporter [Candidatus Dormibacteraeota bacterium]
MVIALLLSTIALAVVFDFTNGFHDTANAIATSISTRALSPRQAVGLSAVLNLLGAVVTVVFFGSAVSNTISQLVPNPTLTMLIAALVGATIWNLVTWFYGLPSSSTHAFVGGLIGAGIASAGSFGGVHWAAVAKVAVGLVLSPPLGFLVAFAFMVALYLLARRGRPSRLNRSFRHLQILTGSFISYSHGSNDAQKSMAAMTMALLVTGHIQHFAVPIWVVFVAAIAIAFGTYAGGWRIIRTLGWRIYKLEPATGMGAQLAGSIVIQVGTLFGFPVSTTHVVTGSVMGAGAPRQLNATAWGVGVNIIVAWILTIPASALIGWLVFAVLHTARLG